MSQHTTEQTEFFNDLIDTVLLGRTHELSRKEILPLLELSFEKYRVPMIHTAEERARVAEREQAHLRAIKWVIENYGAIILEEKYGKNPTFKVIKEAMENELLTDLQEGTK